MDSMQTKAQATVRSKLSELRRLCDDKIEVYQQKIDSISVSIEIFLQSCKSKSQLTARYQVTLGKLRDELRELEDEWVRTLLVKTSKETKQIEIKDCLFEARTKVDELQKIVHDQAASKDEYAAMLSEQLKALAESEERSLEALRRREVIQDTVTWYNRVLGFRINTGQGVTFSFMNIIKNCPSEEYSFTIRYANELYTLLDCKPHLNGIEELVQELNKSNDLFIFVKITRERLQAASSGSISHFIYQDQVSASPHSHGKGSISPHLFLSPRRSHLVAKKQRMC